MSNPATIQQVALAVLRDQGIISLNPNTAQANLVRPTDLDAVALVATQGLQECAELGAAELLEQPGSMFLRAPVNVTLTATQGSNTISALTGYDSTWMPGCTIRITGDAFEDNELLSATTLARPYTGTSGTGIPAVVYHDSLSLDNRVERPIGPLQLAQGRQVHECTSRQEFLQRASFPGCAMNYGPTGGLSGVFSWAAAPFWSMGPKPTAQWPSFYFLEGYYDPTLDHLVRRVRLAPIPTMAQAMGWTNKMTPIRVTRDDIVSPLTTLTVTGATSDTNANQNYAYICDVNEYRAFAGVTHSAYAIFFHPSLASYSLASTLSVASVPAAYWVSALGTSPLGTFNHAGTATGTLTVTTSDSGGGAADPGTKINMPNGWVERIFLPVVRQLGSGLPTFKNDGIKPEIQRQYLAALGSLRAAPGSTKAARTAYF